MSLESLFSLFPLRGIQRTLSTAQGLQCQLQPSNEVDPFGITASKFLSLMFSPPKQGRLLQ
jgi:hypothetical protein